MQRPAGLGFDPLAPPFGSLRALRPGRHVSVSVLVGDPCAASVPGTCIHAKSGPLVFRAPGGGTIRLINTIDHRTEPLSRENWLQVTRFTPIIPDGPRSSELPLRASIVSGPRFLIKGTRPDGPTLTARAGSWLSFVVVLTNRSRKTFRFGRTCPAYTEGLSWPQRQAYVLNCHAVGAIAAGKSVRFEMRIRVPASPSGIDLLGWTLAPHTYDAPEASATLKVHRL